MASFVLSKGRIVASEQEIEFSPRTPTDKVVILVRGFLADATTWAAQPVVHQLADAGFACLGHDFGSFSTWGNDLFLSRMDSVMAYAEARWAKVYAVAASMGVCDVLNWIRRHPGRLKGATLAAGVCKLGALYDRGGGWDAIINTAYGSAAAFAAERPYRDPFLWSTTHTRDPLQLWYSGNDTLVLPSDVIEFATNTLKEPLEQGNVGHAFTGVDATQVAAFFNSSI